MQIVIDIPEGVYRNILEIPSSSMFAVDCDRDIRKGIQNGTPLPKGHGFIAICDSDFPITEEVKQELKNTVFVGNEDCRYCFDITEIIETDKGADNG